MNEKTSAFIPLSAAKAAFIRDLLRHKKARDTERAFVMEGVKPITELLRTREPSLQAVVMTPTWLDKNTTERRRILERSRVPVYVCRDSVFEKLSDLSTAPGLLAVVRQPEWDQEGVLTRSRVFGLYGESLQDPANVGAIIRTALAFGLDALWLSSDSADIFNPKVVRATAGALLRLPVFAIPDTLVFDRYQCSVLAAVLPGTRSRALQEIAHIPPRAVIALGNESRGLSPVTIKQAAMRFHIPIGQDVESLNVAASAAIATFYFSAVARRDEDGTRSATGE